MFVLVVTRQADTGELVRETLGAEGWWVTAVADRETAVRSASDQAPELVVVDGEVAEAAELVRFFASRHGGPGVLLLAPEGNGAGAAGDMDADEVLMHPPSGGALAAAARRLLDEPQPAPDVGLPTPGQVLNAQDIFGDMLLEMEGEAALADPPPPVVEPSVVAKPVSIEPPVETRPMVIPEPSPDFAASPPVDVSLPAFSDTVDESMPVPDDIAQDLEVDLAEDFGVDLAEDFGVDLAEDFGVDLAEHLEAEIDETAATEVASAETAATDIAVADAVSEDVPMVETAVTELTITEAAAVEVSIPENEVAAAADAETVSAESDTEETLSLIEPRPILEEGSFDPQPEARPFEVEEEPEPVSEPEPERAAAVSGEVADTGAPRSAGKRLAAMAKVVKTSKRDRPEAAEPKPEPEAGPKPPTRVTAPGPSGSTSTRVAAPFRRRASLPGGVRFWLGMAAGLLVFVAASFLLDRFFTSPSAEGPAAVAAPAPAVDAVDLQELVDQEMAQREAELRESLLEEERRLQEQLDELEAEDGN